LVKGKVFDPAQVRNIALIGHGGSGKTSWAEAALFTSGATTRMGRVEEGSTVSDYHPDEIERQISINASLLYTEWNNNKINILDTPGYSDFIGEVKACLSVADTALLFIKAAEGIEVGTDIVWKFLEESNLPVMLVFNKVDNEHANVENVYEAARERFSVDVTQLQFPVSQGHTFDAIVDLLAMKLLRYTKDGNGKPEVLEIPDEIKDRATALRIELIEKIAESDEVLMEKYLDAGELSEQDFVTGLKKAFNNRKIFPVFYMSSVHNIGTSSILDFLVDVSPSPQDRPPLKVVHTDTKAEVSVPCDANKETLLFSFKTISEPHVGELSFFKLYSGTIESGMDLINQSNNKQERLSQIYVMNGKSRSEVGELRAGDIAAVVKLKDTHTNDTLSEKSFSVMVAKIKFPDPIISVALIPKAKGEEEKIGSGLQTLHEEDPTFVVQFDAELSQTTIHGQGELHLDIIVKRLKDRFGVDVDLIAPKIPFRETIKKVAHVQGKYKKQSGGRGQYGDVWLNIEPLPRGQEFEFVDAIVGGVVPGKYIPAVEKGVRETMKRGVLAGYPVVDVRTTLDDGSYHAVDSSEMAFKVAASMAFKKAFNEASPVLLEPIYDIEVRVPEEFMGDVMGDISSRRGKIQGMDSETGFQIVRAKVPLSELHKYSTALRSMTGGRGIHKQRFSHYEEVPHEIALRIIEEAKKNKEEEEI
jgi:elongation factor G